jgi:hypothetical protein
MRERLVVPVAAEAAISHVSNAWRGFALVMANL